MGISRTHVPRAVKSLIEDGQIEELRGRVANRDRRMSVYVVTPEGFRKAEEIWESVRTSPLSIRKDGVLEEMEGKALEDIVGRRRAMSLVSQTKDGVVELPERRRAPVRDLLRAPSLDEFHGRERELGALEAFLGSGASVVVVSGNRGYGTTTLVRKFVQVHEERDVLWIPVREHITPEEVESSIVDFGKRVRPTVADLASALSVPEMIVVLDGYRTVSEDVVEFFAALVNAPTEAKLIITSREDNPAYNWFYQKRHVESGAVLEIRVRGLDEASAKTLLGNADIEDEAFRRVYLMTRGQPLLLRMLRDDDVEGLKKSSVYTAEEIRYLLFLKGKTG